MLLFVRTALAAADAGTPALGPTDGGAPASAPTGVPSGAGGASTSAPSTGGQHAAGADAGAPAADAGGPGGAAAAAAAGVEPVVTLPPTVAEQAEGLPIATIDIVGNRRVVARRRPLVPAREARPPLQGREPHGRRARPLGLGLLRGHPGRPDHQRPRASSCASSCASARTSRRSTFEGNDEIENDKLNEAIEIKPNTILSVPAVRRSVQKIKDAYAEKGYFLADVDLRDRCRSARTRSSSSSRSSSTSR